jgi:hypothetical protein
MVCTGTPKGFKQMKNPGFAILMAAILLSCNKENLQSKLPVVPTRPVVNYLPVTITLDETHPGYKIPETFEGLSYETGLLVDSPEFLNENNKVLIQLIKNLGPGVLRIGGNSSDLIKWGWGPRTEKTPPRTLTTSDIDRLAAFDKAIAWPVVFGLNLGSGKAAEAANEAAYVQNSLQDKLYTLQIGNEPDVFKLGPRPAKYNYKAYQYEWGNYFSTIRKEAPGAPFGGPDVTPFNNEWITSFATNENKNIKLIDGHYYVTGPASLPSISYNDILSQNVKLSAYLGTMHTEASKYHVGFRVSECNSVFGGGKNGVSNVFASALWALDFMWEVSDYKGQGINFHGGGHSFFYSPITTENGSFIAKPEYYAMLAFKHGAVGQTILPVTFNHPEYNLKAHACVNADGAYSITLINKELKSSFAFTIQLSKTVSSVQVARLTAPGINSVSTSFAGSTVNDDGSFSPNLTEQYTPNQNSFVINVPAGSAAVITIK